MGSGRAARTKGDVPRRCRAAAQRVLWLQDEADCAIAQDDLDALDDVMRVLDGAYEALEIAALRLPRGHGLREAALRAIGARHTWSSVATSLADEDGDRENEAAHELARSVEQLRGVVDRTSEDGVVSSAVVLELLPRRRAT